jgi:hypothetical protein
MGVQPGNMDVLAEASEQKALMESLVGTVHNFLGEMAIDFSRGC